jgi:hypothetical protein
MRSGINTWIDIGIMLIIRIDDNLFYNSLMIDSLIKQQTAWSQGSSKYQKQKKYTRSEISINLSFYVYIILINRKYEVGY